MDGLLWFEAALSREYENVDHKGRYRTETPYRYESTQSYKSNESPV